MACNREMFRKKVVVQTLEEAEAVHIKILLMIVSRTKGWRLGGGGTLRPHFTTLRAHVKLLFVIFFEFSEPGSQ